MIENELELVFSVKYFRPHLFWRDTSATVFGYGKLFWRDTSATVFGYGKLLNLFTIVGNFRIVIDHGEYPRSNVNNSNK